MEINTIYNEDCLDTMTRMPESFVDLVVTSPPYDNLRNYNGYSFDFESIAQQLYRVIKTGGVCVWVVGDATVKGSETGTSFRQALYFKEIGFNLHDTMIWHKTNPMPTQHNRYENSFEYMFVFSKEQPTVTNILRERTTTGAVVRKKHRASGGNKDLPNDEGFYTTSDTKIQHNVWNVPVGTGKRLKHPAIFPEQLAIDHIRSWSNEGDLVYDPFMGSGTTAKAAKLLNRNYIGSEISTEYCEIIKQRLTDNPSTVDVFEEKEN